MLERIRTLIPLACLVAAGCASDVEGESPPTCIERPDLCPARPDGSFPPSAVVGEVDFPEPGPRQPSPVVPPLERCRGDSVECEGVCVDPRSDPLNCGTCGFECPLGDECHLGECCPITDALCDGRCTDLRTDDDNCGTCGLECEAGLECVIGICTPAARL